MKNKKNYGLGLIVVLVALRCLVGLHFFSEGRTKLGDPKWSSAMFLANAKGPFASMYHDKVWDRDGLFRLNYAVDPSGAPDINIEPTIALWEAYQDRAARHYGFDENQKLEAIRIHERLRKSLEQYVKDYRPDLLEYFHGVRRRDRNSANPAMDGVESLRGQRAKWEKELKGNGAPLIAQVEAFWTTYEAAMYKIAKPEQRRRGRLGISKPGRAPMDSVTVDRIIPYFDVTIGLLLILGLFTRVAAVAGGVFLASVVLSQFPGSIGAAPTWYQAIEMLALFGLAVTAAGQFAGLDGIVTPLLRQLRAPKKTGNTE